VNERGGGDDEWVEQRLHLGRGWWRGGGGEGGGEVEGRWRGGGGEVEGRCDVKV
jgi:hypothetical protein